MNPNIRTAILLFITAAICFTVAACATPQQTAAAITATTATATALIQALAPMLSPEDLAKLQLTAASIDGTVDATATAVRTIADAIASVRNASQSNFAVVTDGLQKLSIQTANTVTPEQLYGTSAGTGLLAIAADRGLSAIKHRKVSA